MFERYTEKARQVIFFARYEASSFGNPWIEAEFLLLGLLRANKHTVLRWLGDGDGELSLREEIARQVHKGPRTPTSVDLPLSHEAERVLSYAAEEASVLSHPFIGTEHLFLGLLRDPQSQVAKILFERGVDAKTVRETLMRESVESDSRAGVSGITARVSGDARRGFQVFIVSEDDTSLPVLWQLRAPAAGEVLTVDSEDGEPTVYQVVRVEWRVSSISSGSPFLTKALIHVRTLRQSQEST
ncbi:MAG TPA: Clp protease N-terminal domain-containing protein [Edaphobacter sp.]|nr:Clp protease N-terminal domain-containing protein [Edaphobacter sp.]